MMLLARILTFVKGLFIPFFLFSQQYHAIRYDIGNGLPTELLKAVITDKHGFVWVASDAGIARFDGTQFFSYPDALPSQYVKGFCMTKDQRLLVASDMGITEIFSEPDTVIFQKLLEGSILPEEGKVNYPKAIYEDSHSNWWISEPTSLLRVSTHRHKRYKFPLDLTASSFFRSFCVLEDSTQRLWVTSYSGAFFMYDAPKDDFIPLTTPEKISNISCLYPVGKRKMFVGCKEGVYEVEIDEQLRFTVFKKLLNLANVSYIAQVKEHTFFVGSFSENLTVLTLTEWGWEEEILQGIQRTKSIFVAENSEIWVATDVGLLLVRPNFFRKITYETSHGYYHYTETVSGKDDTIYAIIKSSIFKIQKKRGKFYAKEIHYDENAYFLSLSCREKGRFWVSSRDKLLYFENDKPVKQYDYSRNNQQYIFYVYEDHRKNVWFRQEGMNGFFQVSYNGVEKRYGSQKGLSVRTEVIRGSFKTGNLYAGGADSLHYLFKYDVIKDSFINISAPLPFSVKTSFSVKDLYIDDQERVWLATTEGLLCYDKGFVRRIFLGKEHTTLPSRAVAVSSYGKIWVANTHGLFMYNPDDEQVIFFDDTHGLPSKTISRTGIFINPPYQKWVATSKGLAYMDEPLRDFPVTKKPIFTSVMVNGNPQPLRDSLLILPHDAYVAIHYVSLVFPGNEVEYQTKLEGWNDDWTTTNKREITFPRLSHGHYTFYVRAKKEGGYRWSEPTKIIFKVQKPWFLHSWAIVLFILGFGFLGWGITAANSWRVRKAQEYLSQLVARRTQELQQANEELQRANQELDMFVYSTSHDLRAPLTSLMGLIHLTKLEKDEAMRQQLLSMMEKSVANLDKFIGDILDYSRNSRLAVTAEPINLRQLLQEILDSMKHGEGMQKVAHFIEIENEELPFFSDKTRLKIIFNNLLSNAIRYADLSKPQPYVKVTAKILSDKAIITVEDNGIGIHKDYQQKVFDMFFRATERNTGSGLGLYIVKETVKALSGKIHLQSELNVGTTFVLEIPNQSQR